MFPKKLVAVLMAAMLSLAMPMLAFANGTGGSGWFVGKSYSGTDIYGASYDMYAGYLDEDQTDDSGNLGKWVSLDVATSSTAPSNWPASSKNLLGTFFTITSNTYTPGEQVKIAFDFPESYDSSNRDEKMSLTFYVEHDDGTVETFNRFVGDSQYCVTGFEMNKLSRIGVAETSSISGGGATGSNGATQSGTAAGGSKVSPKTDIDTSGIMLGTAICTVVVAGLGVVVARRVRRQY